MKGLKEAGWIKACCGCLFTLTDWDYLNSTCSLFTTPTRAAMRLCAFRLLVFHFSPPLPPFLSKTQLFWLKEGKASASNDKLMITSCWQWGWSGRISCHWSAQQVLSPDKMLVNTEEWDSVLLLYTKSIREEMVPLYSLRCYSSIASSHKCPKNLAWRFQQDVLQHGEGGV